MVNINKSEREQPENVYNIYKEKRGMAEKGWKLHLKGVKVTYIMLRA